MKRIGGWVAALLIAAAPALAAEGPWLPELEGSKLAIPWSDFKKLIEELEASRKPPEVKPAPVPPGDYVVTSAKYLGRLEAGSAVFSAAFTLTVLAPDQWVEVPLFPDRIALKDLSIDGKPALARSVGGQHVALFLGTGEHVVSCEFYAPAENRLGPWSASIPVLRAPVTSLEFIVSEPDLELSAEPANFTRTVHEPGLSRLEAALPSTDAVTIAWKKKVEVEQADLRVNAEVQSVASLGERLCRVDSVVNLEILHQGVSSFRLKLPPEVVVVEATGTGLADWRVEKTDAGQVLTARLSFEAKQSYTLAVAYELTLPDSSAEFELPRLEVQDVNRELGHLAVAARTNLEVEPLELEGLGAIDVSELPPAMAGRSADPYLYAYKYVAPGWRLKLKTKKHAEVELPPFVCEKLLLHAFVTRDGELVTRAVWAMRNNREQFLRVKLPPGAKPLSAFQSERPIRPAKDGDFLLLPLAKAVGASGEALTFTVEVTYLTELPKMADKGKLKLDAPTSNVLTRDLEWRLFLPKHFKYKPDQATLDTMEILRKPMEVVSTQEELSAGEIDKLASLGYVSDTGQGGGGGKKSGGITDDTISESCSAGKDGNVQCWVRLVNRDNDEQMTNQYITQQPYSNAPLPSQGATGPAKAALPVRFDVPTSGARLELGKSIVQPDETNSIEFDYKKLKPPCRCRGWLWPGLGLAAVLILALAIVVRSRHKKPPPPPAPPAPPTPPPALNPEVEV